tara:strand:+ start:229 stop:852 length:624 start_codon:yes stop_codon:yes gene_type:complete
MLFKRQHKKESQKKLSPIEYGENEVVDLPQNIRLTIEGKNNRIIFGKKFTGALNISIVGDNNLVQIGRKCRLKKSNIRIRSSDTKIIIGDQTTCGIGCRFILSEKRDIYLGDDCMLSSNVTIRTGDGHSIIDAKSGKRINPADDIVIGNHVWIGFNSIVLKGARIADNCIVGAASLINKKFSAPGCVLAGTPAHIVREGITWDRRLI